VNLIQRMMIRKDLKRLEQRVHDEPSPSTYVDLGQVYINLEMSDKALQAAENGLALFPDSVELEQLRSFARRTGLKARIQDLRAKMTKSPNPKGYRELATMYLDLGDHAAVQSVCEECVVRFPQDAGTWMVQAQARLADFYRDLSARAGLEAVRCLEQVLQLDSSNGKARELLGELLFRVGATRQSAACLQAARPVHGAHDADLQALLKQAQAQAPSGDDVDTLFHEVEETGVLPNPPVTRKQKAQGEEGIGKIRDALAQLAEAPGVQKAAYIRGSRALVKGEIKDGKDPFLRVVRVLAKSAQRFARRLDIGNFSKGVLDGPFGHVCLCSYGEVVAAAQCDKGAAVDRVLADLQELVAGSLYLAGMRDS